MGYKIELEEDEYKTLIASGINGGKIRIHTIITSAKHSERSSMEKAWHPVILKLNTCQKKIQQQLFDQGDMTNGFDWKEWDACHV